MTIDESIAPICRFCQNEQADPRKAVAIARTQKTDLREPANSVPTVAVPHSPGSISQETKALLKKIGLLAVSLAVLIHSAIWPMYQVTQHVPEIKISLEGIIFGAGLTSVWSAHLVLAHKGIRWQMTKQDPVSGTERVVIVWVAAATLSMAGFFYYFFASHGYKISW